MKVALKTLFFGSLHALVESRVLNAEATARVAKIEADEAEMRHRTLKALSMRTLESLRIALGGDFDENFGGDGIGDPPEPPKCNLH